MNVINRKLASGIFGALVMGALGFGVTNALASPQAPYPNCSMNDAEFCAAPYCTFENEVFCMEGCMATWGTSGRCDFWYGVKTCAC